jgi:ribosome production factor 1
MTQKRLAANIPRTIENTRQWDSSSYLTMNPEELAAAQARAYEASGLANPAVNAGAEDDEESDEDMEDADEQPEAGPSTSKKTAEVATAAEDEDAPENAEEEADDDAEEEEQAPPVSTEPPRILMTTSPRPTKATYAFCEELRMVFPGGEFFKRPTGRGFELGRVARWAGKRGYQAVIVVNEDHKAPSE